MDAAPVLATQKRSDRPPEDPGGPCRAWIESDVKGGLYKDFQVSDPINDDEMVPDRRILKTSEHWTKFQDSGVDFDAYEEIANSRNGIESRLQLLEGDDQLLTAQVANLYRQAIAKKTMCEYMKKKLAGQSK